jgi:hypothetical protein
MFRGVTTFLCRIFVEIRRRSRGASVLPLSRRNTTPMTAFICRGDAWTSFRSAAVYQHDGLVAGHRARLGSATRALSAEPHLVDAVPGLAADGGSDQRGPCVRRGGDGYALALARLALLASWRRSASAALEIARWRTAAGVLGAVLLATGCITRPLEMTPQTVYVITAECSSTATCPWPDATDVYATDAVVEAKARIVADAYAFAAAEPDRALSDFRFGLAKLVERTVASWTTTGVDTDLELGARRVRK